MGFTADIEWEAGRWRARGFYCHFDVRVRVYCLFGHAREGFTIGLEREVGRWLTMRGEAWATSARPRLRPTRRIDIQRASTE